MTDPPKKRFSWRGRFLNRAATILTSSGSAGSPRATQDTISEHEGSAEDSVTRGGWSSSDSSRVSIKKKLKEVSLGRSKSLKLPSNPDAPIISRRSARAQSEVLETRPKIVLTDSASCSSHAAGESPAQQPHEATSDLESDLLIEEAPLEARNASTMADVAVPQLLQQGTPMMKVSAKKQKRFVFRLDPDQGQILWESKKPRIIPIENIKELRTCSDARYYREQFQLAQEYEDRWLTIVYILDGQYKTLHLIASTRDVFQMWDITLRKLHAIRQVLMSGLGNIEMRQAVWEKQYWKGADQESDQKLDFEEVERLCKRLNVNSSTDNLYRLFKEADRRNWGFLDFPDFQRFVKLLKARPELDRLFKSICASNHGKFDLNVFEKFMRDSQKTSLSRPELERLFAKYASTPTYPRTPSSIPSLSLPPVDEVSKPQSLDTPTTLSSSPVTLTSAPLTASPAPLAAVSHISLPTPSSDSTTWSLEGFTAFLLSTENSAFADQHGKIWHDMTRPLSEYYISSSHNTYLVGNQLVGVSTIEGYIRALLQGCRSVELDIYDGDSEPMIYHGKTLTSKVSLREVCQAIVKYAFVASPYPIIISAEIHCGLAQQEMMSAIMREVFGDALVCAPLPGQRKIENLPSPEDLRGRILLKAKNLYVSERESIRDKDLTVDTESSSTEASEPEVVQEIKYEWHKAGDSEPVKELKQEFQKARNAFERKVGRHGSRSPSRSGVAAILSGPTGTAALLKPPEQDHVTPKVKMSFALASLLVYTVGVKCRGINKKEHYAPEHVFSLSESTANKILKQGMMDLIKHNRSHLVRIYPKGLRLNSTNYEPHRYWSAGSQLVAINWQTFDLGYMINHAMFQRNGRSGYVLKPLALRVADKDILSNRTDHFLDVTVISAQQLPRPKDSSGHEIMDKSMVDPFVEVSIHVPDWTHSPFLPTSSTDATATSYSPASSQTSTAATSARTVSQRTGSVRNNGFNPVWDEALSLPFDCVGGMLDLVFLRFTVRQEGKGREDEDEPLAVYCASLGSLQSGFRHLPLHDAQLSQYLFSTLFVQINVREI